jgi:hypothetical protein
MLEVQRRHTLGGNDQRRRLERIILVGAARPVDLLRPGHLGQHRGHDLRPGGQQGTGHAGSLCQNRIEHFRNQPAELLGRLRFPPASLPFAVGHAASFRALDDNVMIIMRTGKSDA